MKKEKYILGLNPTGPNTSACLYSNKRGLLSFVEEERFTRIKLAMDIIPTRSIKYCLKNLLIFRDWARLICMHLCYQNIAERLQSSML